MCTLLSLYKGILCNIISLCVCTLSLQVLLVPTWRPIIAARRAAATEAEAAAAAAEGGSRWSWTAAGRGAPAGTADRPIGPAFLTA